MSQRYKQQDIVSFYREISPCPVLQRNLEPTSPLEDISLGTGGESHPRGIGGHLLAVLPLDIVSAGLESSNHLLGPSDIGARNLRRSLGLLASVGVDNLALVGSHVHVLLTITVGNPAR